ncbi:Bug family tripartite tricarboxylate transporter substrate binding protein [Variovorax saccharolyticus]|uniref:Bug family tripartite tricarboxylate transporter substrate binding protein n=1 Tax=Variovorax saccharolyticus TaxID=3053516 RepID=UPI0025775CB2|nr:tripartite tricarboxylate transporter substrate-binding protein [Variovorax sp. J31P216]MDM0025612.1 tripartite tricarboxylate transporter substrate-binding protein [Variovorax sp. J31P216]
MTTKILLAALAALACMAGAQAQTYPSKPIRLVIGYSPAGAADFIARIVADAMGKELGQPILVDNKPGAGSTLASGLLWRAPADGYTLGLATGTLYGIDQHLYKVKYTAADFTPITLLTISPLVLAVNPKLGVNSLGELVAKGRANPGKLNYSSSGIGGSPHLAATSFERAIGAPMAHIPFKGGAPALQAVAAGDVDLSFGTAASVLPLGKQEVVKMLGVTTAQPSAVAPGMPTLASQGLPGFDFTFWFGLFGPANLPREVSEKLFAAATRALADPQVQEKLLGTGNEAAPSASPADFHRWATASGRVQLDRIREANVKVD